MFYEIFIKPDGLAHGIKTPGCINLKPLIKKNISVDYIDIW